MQHFLCSIFHIFGFALFRCLLMNRKRKSKTKTPKNIYGEREEKNDDFFITTIELTYEHQEITKRNSINIKNTQQHQKKKTNKIVGQQQQQQKQFNLILVL